jgi:hypothetical protein
MLLPGKGLIACDEIVRQTGFQQNGHPTTKLTCWGRLQVRCVAENQYDGPGQVQRQTV